MKNIILFILFTLPLFATAQFQIDSIITIDPSCASSNDGTLTVHTSGGVGSVTYDIGSGTQMSNVFTGLTCGSYTAIAIDATPTTTTGVGTVNCQSPLVVTGFSTDAICFGSCDGTIGVTVSGGMPPYSSVVSPAGGFDPSFTSTTFFSGFCAGTYSIAITDANGCVEFIAVTIYEPTELLVSVTTTDETISGACDGTATLTANGGTPGYSYTWQNCITGDPIMQNGGTINSLCPGNYGAIVTDANGCVSNLSCEDVLAGAGCSMLSISSEIYPTCNGVCDGEVYIETVAGTNPYTVTDPFGVVTTYTSNIVLPGYCAGSYTFLVEDALGCTEPVVVNMFEPTLIVTSITSTDETSSGACDGVLIATTSGGTIPYVYTSWQDCSSGSPITTPGAVCPGDYSVTTMDANGCSVTSPCVTVNASACSMVSNFIEMNSTCFGSCDGILEITTTGGVAPYLVTDPFGAVTSYSSFVSLFGYCAGTYTFLVEDVNGCTEIIVATFMEPTPLVATIIVTDETSAGACDGTATAVASGGTAPYMFLGNDCNNLLSLNYTTPTMSSLCADDYYFIVTDNNGCSVTTPCETVSTMNCTMTATYQMLQEPCEGQCNGVTDVIVSGGTAPYTITDPNGGPNETFSINWIFTNLCGGTHVVTITDANGCTFNLTLSIWELPPLDVIVSTTDETVGGICDGTATSTVWGGASFGYTYDWYNCANNQSAGTADSVGGLCPGDYGLVVMDAYGCMGSSFCETVNPGTACNMVSTVQTIESLCAGSCDGTIVLVTSGGTAPYIVIDPTNGNTVSYTSAHTFTNVCPGNYVITITDVAGCTETYNLVITEPVEVVHSVVTVDESSIGACDGSITVSATGGTPGYMYSVNCSGSFQSSPVFSGLCNGAYGVTVVDATGCFSYCDSIDTVSTLNSVGVIANNFTEISVYPNPAKDEITISFKKKEVNISVFTLLGELIYSERMLEKRRIDVSDWAPGIYMLQLKVDNQSIVKRLVIE